MPPIGKLHMSHSSVQTSDEHGLSVLTTKSCIHNG